MSLELRVKRRVPEAQLPTRTSEGAAGYDLYSCQDCLIPAQGKAIVKTGISVALPDGCYGRIAPRSGLAARHHIDIGAGVVDKDYRGEVGVVMFNLAQTDYQVTRGDRIAQLVLERILTPPVLEVEDLDSTERGEGGFGSTGYHSNNLGNSEKPVTNGKRGNIEPDENQVKKTNVSGS
ncbi:uncharacterized protein LOC134819551 [Bolinopsis microptera]|uniref:uncharacterized protein LOC134819551 n=1 Tax=Bolinopsis microptera TaxID=2820187 RepID=UPI003079D7D9